MRLKFQLKILNAITTVLVLIFAAKAVQAQETSTNPSVAPSNILGMGLNMTPHEIYQVATNSFDIWGVSIGSRIFKNEMFDNQSDLTYGGYTCPNVHIQKNFILMHKGDSPINLIYCNSISLALSPENTNEVLAISRHQAYNSSFPGGGDPPLISVFLNSIFEKYGPPTFKTSDENGVTDYYWSTFYKNKKDRVALGGDEIESMVSGVSSFYGASYSLATMVTKIDSITSKVPQSASRGVTLHLTLAPSNNYVFWYDLVLIDEDRSLVAAKAFADDFLVHARQAQQLKMQKDEQNKPQL